jgi:hypothetical protein
MHALSWVRADDLSNLEAAELRLRQHDHWNRLVIFSEFIFKVYSQMSIFLFIQYYTESTKTLFALEPHLPDQA